MRILHTSDWHIGRSFHGHSTLEALRGVLEALTLQVREHDVDVVVLAGDVFDSATPAAGCYTLLTDTLAAVRAAGAQVVVTSGNHDSAARLGFQSRFLGLAGIHVVTDPLTVGAPVTIDDEHGPVHFYGIPFLEPSLVRHHWPDAELRTQAHVMSHAMGLVRADLARRGGRSVAIAHCFAADVEPTPGVEREIRQGTLDVVPLSTFDGPDYVALGHIHGRARLSERVRYAGAPLHYSFGEADKPRGSWLVELDAAGLASVEWLELPVPRRLKTLRGTARRTADRRVVRAAPRLLGLRAADRLHAAARTDAQAAGALPVVRHHPARPAGSSRGRRAVVRGAPARRAERPRTHRRVPHPRARRGGCERAGGRARFGRRHGEPARRGAGMRIHRLEVEGFGPFRDRQTVDFDAFADEGIFLISGRTGSGKSSILDAVCFALYGNVPRYEEGDKRLRSDHSEPGDPTEVVLEFSTGGSRWRIERSPDFDRLKRRGGGTTMQAPAARMFEWVDGAWVGRAARPRDVGVLLDEILGLNQQQFLQVILLAQNRFARVPARQERRASGAVAHPLRHPAIRGVRARIRAAAQGCRPRRSRSRTRLSSRTSSRRSG